MPGSPPALQLIDLEHMGRPESVAAAVLTTAAGPVVIDPGPAVTLPRLEAGLGRLGYRLDQLAALLLTHIHLDHAGASGTLARAVPGLRVYVHELGAPHLIDPSKLLGSATRLYGDRMAELWGEVAAVPAAQVTALQGGERLALDGLELAVAYTPGHAWHHVSYFVPVLGTAFVGDTAGLYGPRFPVVLPVTPPPDFDLEAWLASIERILAWQPARIVLTHYGPVEEPVRHFATLRQGLRDWAGYARDSLDRPGSDAERSAWFTERLEQWMVGRADPDKAARFLAGAGPDACWQGLARYWRKREGAGAVR